MSTPDNAALAAMIGAKAEAERQAANLKVHMDELTTQHEALAYERGSWLQSVTQLQAAIDGMTPK